VCATSQLHSNVNAELNEFEKLVLCHHIFDGQ
jgi:hypothetical protein